MSADGSEADGNGEYWEGYSHYKTVSKSVAETIDRAIDAYAYLDSLHNENAPIQPEVAANARSDILGAVLKLKPELERDRDEKDDYENILDRWEDNTDNDEPGHITKLHQTQLHNEMPAWMFQLMMDIRTAGWELGYLKAGRTATGEPEDPVEADAQQMFEP